MEDKDLIPSVKLGFGSCFVVQRDVNESEGDHH